MAQHVTSQDQIQQVVDEHGNPRVHEGTAPTATGTHDHAMMKGHEHQHEGQQQLRHSGSSSSSSSEEGGRRKKKGVKDKIKETLTGGTHDDDNNKKKLAYQQQPAQTTADVENEGEEKKE